MAEVDSDQEAALRRLRAAFGFVEVLEVIEHAAPQDRGDDAAEEGERSPVDESRSAIRAMPCDGRPG
jgi:hypothetical protein